MPIAPPSLGDDWFGVQPEPLPVAEAIGWVTVPRCGGVAVFLGTVRDHSEGRPGVAALTYEAFEEEAGRRLGDVAVEARRRWPTIGRTVLLHRSGELGLCEVAVVVAVSAPHRAEAFAGARFAIDTLKATVPIWKREVWAGGQGWSEDGLPVAGSVAEAVR